uniref:Uncharacterized protein n=1 Tax=Tanacetum cinerariifolium TaxID=118510 RepID=A0A6L2NQZ7_TANCI|nr:hypothetical protein [Tanacetum cinerariifolium]
MTIDQQVALDEALVPHASRLRIGKSTFRLRSDIASKESTLQVVYDVLRLTSFFKAFLVTADVPDIYMQEFWATAIVHHHSIRFKMNNKKCIVNLEYFREMLHICPRIPNQTFDELPFKEEILVFLRYLGHSEEIKKITYGMYHKKNVDFAYLLWEDFLYQVEHKYAKKSNDMYYPIFTKVIINFFMTKDLSIPKRNKFGAILPVELINEDIKNSAAYKEYYAIASRATPPKTKASIRKTRSSLFVLSEVAMTEAEQIKLAIKRSLQQTHISQASGSSTDEGTGIIPGVPDVPTDESDEEISWKLSDKDDDDVDDQSETDDDDDDQEDEDEKDDDDQDDNDDDQESDNDGDDFVHPKLSTHDEEAKDEESFDHIIQTPSHMEDSDDESNDDESHGMIVKGDEEPDAEDDDEELYRDVNINLEGRDIQMIDVHTTQVLEDTHMTLTLVNPEDGPVTTTVVPLLVTAPTLPSPSIPIMSQVQQAPAPTPITALSTSLQDLLNCGSLFGFDHRLKTLEANFFEFMQTNRFTEAISSILEIVDRYIDHRMNEAVKVVVQLQSDRLRDEAQTSYVVAADLSEMELKKILIEKMESNKSIHRSDEQRNLYKALVDAYECDEIILDTYRDTVTLKRHHDDANKDEEPSVGSDRGSKRKKEGKEPESTSAPKEKTSKTTGKSTEASKSHHKTTSESAPTEEAMQTTQDLEEPSHQEFETGATDDQPIAEAS